jgi:Ni,Fe-hydrogenase I large subunit
MTVLSVTITDPTFDKKSAEVGYLAGVLQNVAAHVQRHQGTVSTSTTVMGVSSAGVPNTVVASYTYTASASNP